MIELERTKDYDLVRMVMTNPKIYPGLADDFYPAPENFWPTESDSIYYLMAMEDGKLLGIYITHPINTLTWETHHAILPENWGAKATEIGAAFEAWLWVNTPATKAVGFTPTSNPLAIRYAKKAGMQEAGRLDKCYQKDFALYDIVIFSKSRPGMEAA